MKCPKCSRPSEVVKVYQFDTEARRRRECTACGFRFSTTERVWRRVYADEKRPRPERQPRRVEAERPRRTYSNFDIVALDNYDMDYEDVTTFVHVSDD